MNQCLVYVDNSQHVHVMVIQTNYRANNLQNGKIKDFTCQIVVLASLLKWFALNDLSFKALYIFFYF